MLTGEDLLEIGAPCGGGAAVRRVRRRSDVAPVGREHQQLLTKLGSSALTFCRSASFASTTSGLADTARLKPIIRLSRLPMWSSTWAASRRASLRARSIADAWSIRHWFQRPAPISAVNGITVAITSPRRRVRMLLSSIGGYPLIGGFVVGGVYARPRFHRVPTAFP